MSKYDFGEEQLRFIFERWQINEQLADTEKIERETDENAEGNIEKIEWLEGRLHNYMEKLENWAEGKEVELENIFKQEG